jgi:transposase
MERHEDAVFALSKLNLYDIEKTIHTAYHQEGPGRPPRNPLGIFKALMTKRLRQIPSDRELYRRLWNDPLLRMICDIEEREKPYHPSQLTRFRSRVGPEKLERIIAGLVEELIEGGIIRGETVAMDATFIKAYSKRDSRDNRRGSSDPDAMVGRDGRTYGLGYKAHIAGDVYSDLPLAYYVAPANENEKRHAPGLLLKAVEAAGGRVEKLVADSQYSSRRFRGKVADCGVMAVIPYPSNQRKGEDVLRVDKFFRVYGSEEERRLYGLGRSSIERVNSRLEEQVCLDRHRVRGLRNVAVHVALCIIAMLLVAVAALRLGVPWKARSIATFGW